MVAGSAADELKLAINLKLTNLLLEKGFAGSLLIDWRGIQLCVLATA